MATTQNTYTGDNSTVSYSFTFPYLEETDIKVSLDGVVTTAYSLSNATTVTFDTAPGTGVAIRIYRDTNNDALAATFFAGSAIRAQDLNDDFLQNAYVTQEVKNRYLDRQAGGNVTGDVTITGDVTLTGAVGINGILDMNGNRIIDVADPTSAQDAATKAYIDARFGDTQLPQTTRWKFTATGGETALTGNDDGGITLQYSVAHEQVYLNGALQQRGVDYTAEEGSTITFTTALTAGDVVNVISVNNIVTVDAGANTDTLPQTVWSDTATAGQTTFSGTGNEGSTLAYQVAGETVILNGSTLTRNVDYTASTGTSIVLTTGAEAGDQLLVISANYIATSVASTLDAGNFNFTATGTGAQTRTVSDKLRDVVSVKDFGAVGDGVTDDTSAIQAAIDSCAARLPVGQSLFFPAGYYRISDTLSVPANSKISLIGESIETSQIRSYVNARPAISIGDASVGTACLIQNLWIQHYGASKVGTTAIYGYRLVAPSFINQLRIEGFGDGLVLDGANTLTGNVFISDFQIGGCSDSCIYIKNDYQGAWISDGKTYGESTCSCLKVQDSAGIYFDRVEGLNSGTGFEISATTGKECYWIFLSGCIADSNASHGIKLSATGTGVLRGVTIRDTWSSSNNGSGIYVTGDATSTLNSFALADLFAINNGEAGCRIGDASSANVDNISILGGIFSSNNQSLGAYGGIDVAAGQDGFQITGTTCGAISSHVNRQTYGIRIVSGNSSNYIVTNNQLLNNVTGDLFDGGTGTGKTVTSNGIKREGRGTFSVSGGAIGTSYLHGNVSSVTYNSVGNYTVNFATPLPSSSGYAALVTGTDNRVLGVSKSTTSLTILSRNTGGTPADSGQVTFEFAYLGT